MNIEASIFYNEVLTGAVKVTATATLRREGREKSYYFFPSEKTSYMMTTADESGDTATSFKVKIN